MTIRGILFDLGDTLVHYAIRMRYPGLLQEVLAISSQRALEIGLEVPADDLLQARAQDENHESPDYRVRPLLLRLAHIYGLDETHPALDSLSLAFCRVLLAVGELYSDTLPTLQTLRQEGYRLGVVSNLPWGCPSAPWHAELERLGLAEYLEAIVFCSDVGWRKPAPQPFQYALGKLGLKADECVFVGDDPRWDLAGPHALGMPAIVLDRAATLDLPGETVIHRLDELAEVVRLISKG